MHPAMKHMQEVRSTVLVRRHCKNVAGDGYPMEAFRYLVLVVASGIGEYRRLMSVVRPSTKQCCLRG